MGVKVERQKEKQKITLIAILLAGSCFLTYYFHEILETGTFFTHLFYIPIILASLWWKRKGLAVAIFLAVFLIFSHHFLRDYVVTANDYLRALMFVVIGLVVALLSERVAKAQERTAHLNAVLRAIRNVNQLITREKDRDRLLKGICDNLIETRGYHNAWIALLDETGGIVTTAESGLGKDFLPVVERLERGELTDCGQKALKQSDVVVTEDPSFTCADCPLSAMYSGRGAMTVRLEHAEKVYGLLCASIPTNLTAYEEEQSLFKEVAGDIAFALNSIGLEEKQRQAEEEEKKLQAQLREAKRMEAIATLAGGIAHEFNNTLVGITGNIDLLQMDLPDDKKIDKYAERMRASALHMAHLTDQLLAYARGGKYQPKNISLTEFVQETLPLIKQTISPSIRLETDLLHLILNVEADLTQMQMVLSAILNNSAEAIEGEGRIRIITKNEEIDEEFVKTNPDLKPGPYVSFTVEDDGKGMEEETRSRIFDPFFTTKFQGRGLGMAAVYGIVTNHGGWISVDSELGKGTVVRIYLPAVKVQVKEVEKPKIEPTKGTGTILVVEDEDIVIDVICAMVKRLGYRVLLARTGKEAVSIAKGFDADIDLAILDILLPDLPAKEVYTDIMEARPNLKVVVCSGYAIDGPPQEIMDAGAQDFIQKPFSYATLSEKLKEVLEGK